MRTKRVGALFGGLALVGSLWSGSASRATVTTQSVLDRLVANGLRVTGNERACVGHALSKASPTKNAAKTKSNPEIDELDDDIGRILGCIPQEQAVQFIAGSLEGDGPTSVLPTSAFAPVEPIRPTRDCLTHRMRVATWSEVTEAFRSYAEAVLSDFNSDSKALLASRVRPYAATCAVLKNTKGTTPLPPLTPDDVRVRWNASVRRHPLMFAPVARWVNGRIPSTMEAAVAANGVLTISISDSLVGVVTVVLARSVASPAATSRALYTIADVIDGRDRAVIVDRAFDLSALLARTGAGQAKIRVGRTIYSVSVALQPPQVIVSGFPS